MSLATALRNSRRNRSGRVDPESTEPATLPLSSVATSKPEKSPGQQAVLEVFPPVLRRYLFSGSVLGMINKFAPQKEGGFSLPDLLAKLDSSAEETHRFLLHMHARIGALIDADIAAGIGHDYHDPLPGALESPEGGQVPTRWNDSIRQDYAQIDADSALAGPLPTGESPDR